MVQAALFVSAISTLLQLFPIGKRQKFAIGAGLPVIMGVSFAYVPSMQAIAEGFGVATILGAQIVGGVVAIVVGVLVKKIRRIFFLRLSLVRWYLPLGFLCIPQPLITWQVEQTVKIMVPGRTGWLPSSPL